MTVGTWLTDLQNRSDGIAIKYKSKNNWEKISWSEYLNKTVSTATQIRSQGFKRKDHIGILSSTRWEWIVMDMAILGSGFVSVPLYANLSDDDLLYIINHSEIKLLVIENSTYLNQIDRIKSQFIKPILIKKFEDFEFNLSVHTNS